jgi:hypothetical protein
MRLLLDRGFAFFQVWKIYRNDGKERRRNRRSVGDVYCRSRPERPTSVNAAPYRYQLTLSRRPRAVSLECPQFSGYKRRRPLIYACETGWATPSEGNAVGLSWQQGPLLPGAIGRFLVPEPLPKRLLWAEPLRRRRAEDFGGNREKAPD